MQDGDTALMWAAFNGESRPNAYTRIVRLLLRHGANKEARKNVCWMTTMAAHFAECDDGYEYFSVICLR